MRFFSKFGINKPSILTAEMSIANLESLVKLSSLGIGYVPWSSSSMTPRAIIYILNEIILNKKSRVLELGMGISTFYIAKLMKDQTHVSLMSIDNDESWIKVCRDQIQVKNLETARHKILHAPLKGLNGEGNPESSYYNLDYFMDEIASFSPDLLVIDGPPAWKPEISDARVPAHQFLAALLSSNSSVFIDDYTRSGESKLVESFLATPGWYITLKDPLANIAILRNNSSHYNAF